MEDIRSGGKNPDKKSTTLAKVKSLDVRDYSINRWP